MNKFRFKRLLILTLLSLLFPFEHGYASDGSSWAEDKERLEKLVAQEKCEAYWDILWPWAKTGNLEARMILLTLLAPPVHGTQIVAPGTTGDLVSRVRDITITAVHASDYKGSEESNQYYRDLAYDLYLKQGFEESPEGREFLKCVKEGSSNCSDVAVKGKLVPSFDEYAKQINIFTNSGMKSTCKPAYSEPQQ